MRILIAAGGSGGHIFPAIALARALAARRPDIRIKFVGSNKALDRRIYGKEAIPYSLLSANKLPYRLSPGIAIFLAKFVYDALKSFFIVLSYRPHVTMGFGGYVSGPVVAASWILRIPCIVHEQNVVPGRANAFLFKLAERVAISFERTRKFTKEPAVKVVFTGNPLRNAVFPASRSESLKRLGLAADKFTVLVMGGSQGAHSLNEMFIRSLGSLGGEVRSAFQILHITGAGDSDWAAKEYSRSGVAYRTWAFLDSIEDAYSAANIAVTRSGSSAIFELALFGKPMILVPYPFAMSHQTENARVFSAAGAAIEMQERDLSPEAFAREMSRLAGDRGRLETMEKAARNLSVPRASDNLADEVLMLAGRRPRVSG